MNNKKTLQSNLLLVLTALIWGVAFVAQHAGNEIGSFTFNAVRSFVGGVALLPVIFFFDRRNARLAVPKPPQDKKKLVIGGICCGTALAVASSLQQIGIGYTTVGKAGFITALYIIIVPILGIFLKKKVPLLVWLSVLIAAAGMYLLCIRVIQRCYNAFCCRIEQFFARRGIVKRFALHALYNLIQEQQLADLCILLSRKHDHILPLLVENRQRNPGSHACCDEDHGKKI